MKHVFDDELFCSLKNELSEVSAQIDAQSAKLMGLIDQKKEYPLYTIIFLSILLNIRDVVQLYNKTSCFYLFSFYLPRKCERCERGFVTFVFFKLNI